MRRKVCVVSVSRADYGLLRPLIDCVRESSQLDLMMIACGSHFAREYGLTVREIEIREGDAFFEVDPDLSSDTPTELCTAFGKNTAGISRILEETQPDIVVLLGDRLETLAAAVAATINRVPIAHIHGGESTLGLTDEAIRHSITKMSHLHFTAAEPYRQRVLQLGESPDRVWVTGAMVLDTLSNFVPVNTHELETFLNVRLLDPVGVVTFHPPTLSPHQSAAHARELVEALRDSSLRTVVITAPGAEPERQATWSVFREFASQERTRVVLTESLGHRNYLSLLRYAAVVIGNSSSGIIEAPFLGTPTVDIGNRQQGRLRGPSVLSASPERESIGQAVRAALDLGARPPEGTFSSPYGVPGASKEVTEILETVVLDGLIVKEFVDLK